MRTKRDHLPALNRLAARWRWLGLYAVAFARMILRLETGNVQKAHKNAEMLEAWCYAASVELSREISALPGDDDLPEAAEPTVRYLKAVAFTLMQLALVARYFRERMAARLNACPLRDAPLPLFVAMALPAAPHRPAYLTGGNTFFDTS